VEGIVASLMAAGPDQKPGQIWAKKPIAKIGTLSLMSGFVGSDMRKITIRLPRSELMKKLPPNAESKLTALSRRSAALASALAQALVAPDDHDSK
jgi:hypothetical protein